MCKKALTLGKKKYRWLYEGKMATSRTVMLSINQLQFAQKLQLVMSALSQNRVIFNLKI